jgi:hypothetical protein
VLVLNDLTEQRDILDLRVAPPSLSDKGDKFAVSLCIQHRSGRDPHGFPGPAAAGRLP